MLATRLLGRGIQMKAGKRFHNRLYSLTVWHSFLVGKSDLCGLLTLRYQLPRGTTLQRQSSWFFVVSGEQERANY
jgi:hypothetical protein